MGGVLVPAVGGPGVVDEVPDGDDGVGPGDECLDHPGAHLGTDLEPAEAAGVPGVGAFGHPAPTGLQRGASGGRSGPGSPVPRAARGSCGCRSRHPGAR